MSTTKLRSECCGFQPSLDAACPGIGHQPRRIAGAARANTDRHGDSQSALDDVDYLPHGIPLARSEIQSDALAPAIQVPDRSKMSICEVHHMGRNPGPRFRQGSRSRCQNTLSEGPRPSAAWITSGMRWVSGSCSSPSSPSGSAPAALK